MRTIRIPLLLAVAVVVTACGFVENRRDAAARLLSSAVMAPVLAVQSEMPLTQERYSSRAVKPAPVQAAAVPEQRTAPRASRAEVKTAVRTPRVSGRRVLTEPRARYEAQVLTCSSTSHDDSGLNGLVPVEENSRARVMGS